jgi:DnaK suppressor protein
VSTQTIDSSRPTTPRHRRYGTLTRMRAAGQHEVRTRLQDLLRSLPDETAEVCDEQEHVDRHIERELDFTLLAMRARTLRVIDQALERFRRGEDADCVECGTAIGAARLRALPFATRCYRCQDALESSQLPS